MPPPVAGRACSATVLRSASCRIRPRQEPSIVHRSPPEVNSARRLLQFSRVADMLALLHAGA